MYLIHPLVSLPVATMVSVSPVQLPSGPQELHVHEDCVCEYLMRQYGLQQVDVVLECEMPQCSTSPETVSNWLVLQAQSC